MSLIISFNSFSLVDLDDLRPPITTMTKSYLCGLHGTGQESGRGATIGECVTAAYSSYAASVGASVYSVETDSSTPNGWTRVYLEFVCHDWQEKPYPCRGPYDFSSYSESESEAKECPPVGSPDHTHPVEMAGGMMCGKLLGNTGDQGDDDNEDSCPKSSGFDMPELAFGVGDSTQMCFPNPNGGAVCKYNSDDGVFQLPPTLGESVNCDTGQPEDPFPDNPDDTDTPDNNGCVVKKGKKYCSAKPEDNCKVANAAVKVGDTWDTSVLTCDAGCGDIGGIFYCPDTPEDDQEPEINDNCTDEVFRLANPTVCSGKTDDTTDKNGDGKVDNSDVVKGLNTGNQLTESILSELKKGNGDQTEQQNKLNEKAFATNQLLSELNNKVSGTNNLLKKVTDKLDEPLGTVTKGKFDIATAQSELEQINIDYQAKINSIKTEALTLIQNLNAGGGSFNSCHDLVSMNGKVYNRCLTQFSEEMTPISNGILFFFTVVAGFIVLGGASKND